MSDIKYGVSAGFFDAIDEDRKYSADDMNKPYKRIITNGVFATPQGEASTDLQVLTADDGMNVLVSAGDAMINYKWFINESSLKVAVSSNTSTLPRIDSIIAQIDTTQSGRVGNIVYREGTAASSPVHPDINTEDGIHEFRLADISVSASCAEITQDLITDCRGTSECPWITALIQQVDTSTLYEQWYAAYQKYYDEQEETFSTWFEKIKGLLEEDSAGNLQLEIDALSSINRGTATISSGATITNGYEITLPYYYKVGNNSLELRLNSEVLVLATDDTDGHYTEVGDADELSNIIAFNRTDDDGSWTLDEDVVLTEIVRGVEQ